MRTSRTWRVVACLAALAAVTAACSDDDDAADDTTTTSADDGTTTSTSEAEPTGETITITGRDYLYEGVPDDVEAGQEITFVNDSSIEVHEIVVVRLPDDESRSIEELATLGEDEVLDALFATGPPAVVVIALPGGDPVDLVGDGTLTEPGRYAIVCTIRLGADVDAYADLLDDPQPEESGQIPGGPPHFTQGMYAETRVS